MIPTNYFPCLTCTSLRISLLYYQDYQFWTRADETGYFSINNVQTGDYNLFAWVPGFIGDYKNEASITVTPGSISVYYMIRQAQNC